MTPGLCVPKTPSVDLMTESLIAATMVALIFLCLNLVASLFKSKSRLEAENAALRHQLTVPRRKIRGRVQFTNGDRLFFIQLYRWCPSVLKAMMIIPRIMQDRAALKRGSAQMRRQQCKVVWRQCR
jgi:hypothetical protein